MAIILDGSAGLTLPVDLAESEGGTGVSASNIIVQSIRTDSGALATGTTIMPKNDTIPQNTEGTEFITVSITPKNTVNKLIIEGRLNITSSGLTTIVGGLFQDAIVSAISGSLVTIPASNYHNNMIFSYEMVAGSTSTITFKLRAGPEAAATIAVNGSTSTRFLGGVLNSYLKVTEVTP